MYEFWSPQQTQLQWAPPNLELETDLIIQNVDEGREKIDSRLKKNIHYMNANNMSAFSDILHIGISIICLPEMYIIIHLAVVVLSFYNTGLSTVATGPRITCTSQSYSPVQQQWGITYNCLVGLFLSHVSPNSALLTSGIWLSQKLTRTERARHRGCRKREIREPWETESETGHSTAPGCETLPIFLSDRIISMHSTGEWKLPFTHKNMARIVNYRLGLFFSLCHPFAYCSYEKVLLM